MNSWTSSLQVLMRTLESGGHRCKMFRRAVCRFSELKAFHASTRITASVFEDSKIWCIAWTAASQPDKCPAHTWRGPAASWISSLMEVAIATSDCLPNTNWSNSRAPTCIKNYQPASNKGRESTRVHIARTESSSCAGNAITQVHRC